MSDLGPEAREILRRGRDVDDPTPADRARLRRAIMASIAAGTAVAAGEQAAEAAAAAKTGTAMTLGGAAWKGFVVLIVAGAVGAGVAARPTPKTLLPISTSFPVNEKEPAPVAIASESPEPSFSASSKTDAPRRALPKTTASITSPNPEPDDTLLAETKRLREAHGALQGGDAERALALLDAQTADAEGQKLREERAAARVLALCKLGRVAEANEEASRFLQASPRSPLADRVRKACQTSP